MEPFIAQIIMFGGNFSPRGWALCDGQLLSISQYTALFSLLGTTYGGDGRTTFALPDLRGRAPIHVGTGPGLTTHRLGERSGTETVTLTQNQMPNHTHTATASSSSSAKLKAYSEMGNSNDPTGRLLANAGAFDNEFLDSGTLVDMGGDAIEVTSTPTITIGSTGGQQPANNMQPYLAINYIIALQGIFPSRS